MFQSDSTQTALQKIIDHMQPNHSSQQCWNNPRCSFQEDDSRAMEFGYKHQFK